VVWDSGKMDAFGGGWRGTRRRRRPMYVMRRLFASLGTLFDESPSCGTHGPTHGRANGRASTRQGPEYGATGSSPQAWGTR